MNWARKRSLEPTTTGGGASHSTALMFLYQAIALAGSAAKADTSSRGRLISISVTTSTNMAQVFQHAAPVSHRHPTLQPQLHFDSSSRQPAALAPWRCMALGTSW